MGFWLKILVILCFSLLYFNADANAQDESNNYISIKDFTIHKVTPVKTSTVETASNEGNTTANKTPKLRGETQTKSTQSQEKNTVIISVTDNYPKDSNKNIYSNKILQKSPEVKTSNEVKTETPETIKDTPQQAENPIKNSNDETSNDIVKNINKINDEKLAQTNDTDKESDYVKDSGLSFLKTFFSLGVVIFIIFIVAWVYARIKGINPAAILTGNFSEKDLNRFNVLSSSTLGQGKDIHLVEINGKQLVIGSTANNINLLTEISPEEVEKLKEQKHKSSEAQSHENTENAENIEPVDVLDEEDFYYEPFEEDTSDSEFFPFKYTDLYKEYLNKKDKPEE